MEIFSGEIPRRPPWGVSVALFIWTVLTVFNNAAVAEESANAVSFHLSGIATITADVTTQQSESLTLKANLTPIDAALKASPPVQEGGSFALMAALGVPPLVCYNDTIFRDDFDGDGG
jgi:hypothetical protein